MVVCYNLFVNPLGSGMWPILEACSVMSNMQQKPWDSVKRTTQPSPVVGGDSVTAWSGPRQAHHSAGVRSTEKKWHTGTHVKCVLIMLNLKLNKSSYKSLIEVCWLVSCEPGTCRSHLGKWDFNWENGPSRRASGSVHRTCCWLVMDTEGPSLWMGLHPWAGGPRFYERTAEQRHEEQARTQHFSMTSLSVPASGFPLWWSSGTEFPQWQTLL